MSEPNPAAERPTLRRQIGLLDATMIVVSGIIGGGIFFTPATVAARLPYEGWIMAAWLAGAVIAFAGALTFAELGARYPQAGGHYVYIREAFGSLPAFLYGWMLLLIIATGALASLALAFAGYVAAFIPLDDWQQRLLGIGIVAALSILNIIGVRPGARTTTILTTIKVLGIALLVLAGLMVPKPTIVFGEVPTMVVGWPQLLLGFLAALVPVSFTYGGWQQLNFVAGEITQPQRNIPRALAFGVAIVAIVYLGANAFYLAALGPIGMAQSTAIAQQSASVLFGDVAGRLVTVLVAISILAFSNVVVMVTPRVFYALAQDGVFLRKLASVHPRFHTPARAIALQGSWAMILVAVGNVGVLVSGVVFADWIFFGLGAASLFIIRRQGRDNPAFTTPGYPWVPAFFVLAAVAAVTSAVVSYPRESLIGLVMLVTGALLYRWR